MAPKCPSSTSHNRVCMCLALYQGSITVQFLIAYHMRIRRGKAWFILNHVIFFFRLGSGNLQLVVQDKERLSTGDPSHLSTGDPSPTCCLPRHIDNDIIRRTQASFSVFLYTVRNWMVRRPSLTSSLWKRSLLHKLMNKAHHV